MKFITSTAGDEKKNIMSMNSYIYNIKSIIEESRDTFTRYRMSRNIRDP